MKHVISDLQEEAASWDAMLLLSPMVLTDTINAVDHNVATYNL